MGKRPILGEVWSATPTPLTPDRGLAVPSVARLVEHHVKVGVTGLMLAGTCGEGRWLSDEDREEMIRATVAASQGRLRIAAQATHNSAIRTLRNIERAAALGVEIAVIAQPIFDASKPPRLSVDRHLSSPNQRCR